MQINCEEPLVERNDLLGKLPSIQLDELKKVWSCGYDKTIAKDEFAGLLTYWQEQGML